MKKKKLLKRIKKLEKRIEALEARPTFSYIGEQPWTPNPLSPVTVGETTATQWTEGTVIVN